MFNKLIDNFKSVEFEVNGNTKVKYAKKNFEEAFGVPIRIYNGTKFADEESTLAKIRKNDIKGAADIKIKMSTKVGEAEKLFLKNLGVKVQVCDKKGDLADNKLTLGELARLK